MTLHSRRTAASLAVSALVVGTVAATAAPASAATPSSLPKSSSELKQPLSKQLAAKKGPVDVLVETTGTAPTAAFAAHRSAGLTAARSAERSAQQASATRVAALQRQLAGKGRVLYSTTRVLPGVAVHTDAANLRAIAALPGVARVLPLTMKTRSNSRADVVTKALNTWVSQEDTGEGVTVGVIDTGIDYTHADFGGGGLGDFEDNDTTHIPSQGAPYQNDVAFPTAKVVAGYDFAGDAYDGGNAAAPDPDPVDCATADGGGHGSHVSGTVAGFGVTSAGTTFTGDYTGLDAADLAGMNIGPGAAPNAKLVALRVFGCQGGTLLVTKALDYVAQLNSDDDDANDVDILNLSLGSGFTRGDDPDAQAIDAIADTGVLPVISAGNDGDLYGAVGSPGSARKALTVAATDDGVDTVDGVKVSIDGTDSKYPATNSIAYDYRGNPADKVGQLVKLSDPTNLDGCKTLSPADAAAVSGKYAFLEWDDNDATRACGSVGRSGKVKAAGALGAVFGSNAKRFSAGITGDEDIPVTLTNKDGADAIRAALTAGKTVTATFGFTYRAGTSGGAQIVDLPATDSIASFTSRGGTPADGYLKPDIGAPGLHTFSANAGTGNEGLDESGTSMASPHTAGIAALLKAAHPTWTPEELKAGLMNSATGVLTVDGQAGGAAYGVTRVGAGRVSALDAVSNDVVAFDATDPGSVGLGFGNVAVTGPTTRTKTVTVESFGAAKTYAISYASSQDVPGVTFVPSVSSISVPAGTASTPGKATFTVSMVVSSVAALRKTPDATVDAEQSGIPRVFQAEENGRLLLTPNGGGLTLKLPAAVAPRPASSMTAASSVSMLREPHGLTAGSLPLTGTPVSNGAEGDPDAVQSLVGGFQLQATSPALNACLPTQVDGCLNFPSQRAGDLQYVGATVSDGLMGIALTTRGNFNVPAYNPTATGAAGEVAYVVTIDTDGNGSPDREIDVTRLAPDTDIYVAETYDFVSGDVLDDEPINSVFASRDTVTVGSNALVLPVFLDALNLPPNRSTISYTVTTYSLDDTGSTLDSVGPLTFDTAHPAVRTVPTLVDDELGGTLLSPDEPGALKVVGDLNGAGVDNQGLLLVHLHNTDATRAQVVSVSTGGLDPKLTSYTPLSPVRLAAPGMNAGRVVDLPVAGTHGVPSDATSVVLAVSTTGGTAASAVSIAPTGGSPQTALNLAPGRPTSNLVTVPLGQGGKVRVSNQAGSVIVHLDVQGYYRKGLGGSTFVPADLHRVLDTRSSGGALASGATRDLKVNALAGVPADATAVAVEVTALSPTANDYLTVYPKPAAGTAFPATVNVAAPKGSATTTTVVSKLGPDGSIRLRGSGGATQVTVDLVGWYVPSDGAAFTAVTPARVLDTRFGIGAEQGQIAPGDTRDVRVAGVGAVPADATSVVITLTGLQAVKATSFTAYPTGANTPFATTSNLAPGVVSANQVVVPVGDDGSITVLNRTSSAHLTGYVTGYFTG